MGFDVVAIDLASSEYAGDRIFPVVDYDGRHIPLADGSVDAIFSSNVLEHIEDLSTILGEFRRVLKPGGLGVHAMPTPQWRFWTFIAGPPTALIALSKLKLKAALAALLPLGHGTSKEGISELWTFSPKRWCKTFRQNGMEVVEDRPIGIFYTGHFLFGEQLSFERRRRMSRKLGSGAHIYVTRAAEAGGTQAC
jgi:SAM-dependent methyltransferase